MTLGDADELLLPLAEGGMTRVLCHAAVCETTLVVPLHAVMRGTTRALHLHLHVVALVMTRAPRPHPRVVVPEMNPALLLHAEADATPLVHRPRPLRRDREMDEDTLVVILLLTEEMTDLLRLASGIWMGGIAVDGMVDMSGGARMTIVKESGMNDLLEVTGGEGCLTRGRETMVAGDDLLWI